MRRSRSALLAALVAIILCVALPASAQARSVRLTAGGVSLTAPAGYRLAAAPSGTLTLTGPTITVSWIRGFSNQPLRAVGSSLAARAGAGGARKVITPTSYRFTAGRGAALRTWLVDTRAAYQYDVYRIRVRAVRGRASSRAVALRAPTAAELAQLLRMMGTRRGQRVADLGLAFRSRTCTAPDGKSSAQIPDLQGMTCNGGNGGINAAANGVGGASLGALTPVSNPGLGATGVVAAFVSPEQAIREVWPQALASAGTVVTVQAVTPVPGTENVLGANIPSQLFGVRATIGEAQVNVIMLSGYIDAQSLLGWVWYTSYVWVVDGSPSGFGDSLLNTWRTWDATPATQDRLRQTLETLRATRAAGGPIDPVVFDVANQKWGEYFRG